MLPQRPGDSLPLSVEEAHHALHVLRLRDGDEAEVFDGSGGRCRGRVSPGKKGAVAIVVEEMLPALARATPLVHLAFAVPKGKRLDWLLEKATELGAASLQPIVFERSVAGGDDLSDNKRQRWLGHCVAAAKQCGLDYLPELRPPVSLAEGLRGFDGLGLFGDLAAGATSAGETLGRRCGRDVTILVGPEGGLGDLERDALLAAGFVGIRLGRTVLRIETAAIALLAVCQL